MTPRPDKYVTQPRDIPNEEHWAIVTGSSYSTTASHGYPSTTEHVIRYEVYLRKENWLLAVKEKMLSKTSYREDFKAIHVIPATFDVEVKIAEKRANHGF